jgi:hypothetical protein
MEMEGYCRTFLLPTITAQTLQSPERQQRLNTFQSFFFLPFLRFL